ncbi:MAG: hypothetical protein ACSW8C_04015 [bacterium]
MELNLTFTLNMLMEPLLAQELVMLMQKKICLNPLEMRVKSHLDRFNVFNEKILRIQIDMRDI